MNGYGKYGLSLTRQVYTHRLAYTLFVRPLRANEWVLHRCDNRRCFNPDHLEVGNVVKNNKDMFARNRARPGSGERHGFAKLNWNQVREIRALHRTGESFAAIGRRFGLDRSHVRKVVKQIWWKEKP